MNKRQFVRCGAAMAALPLCTADPAQASPTLLAIGLSLIAAGGSVWSAKVSADRTSEAQLEVARIQAAIERMKMEFEFQMRTYQMGNQPVRQQTALDSGYPARQGWTDDVDGEGTYMGLSQGRIAVSRGKYQGTVSTAEVERFSRNMARGQAMPVPLEDGYHSYSASEADRVRELVGTKLPAGSALIGGRRYSIARSPTVSGWDLESIIYADRSNDVRALNLRRDSLQVS